MVAILIMSAKLVILGLLKIKIFQNNEYDVMISVHDVTNEIFSGNSNYIIDMAMGPKFGNSSLSMREVIITSVF